MYEQNQEGSARRTFGGKSGQWSVVSGQFSGQDPRPKTRDPSARLSVAAQRFLDEAVSVYGNRWRTVQGKTCSIWYLIEFVGRDPAVGELPADLLRRWVEWLRTTPAAPRKPWTMPKRITPETVAAFLSWPPERSQTLQRRSEQTLGRYIREARAFLAGLGLDVRLPKKRRGVPSRDHAPRLALPPPLVPAWSDIARWWSETLDPENGPARDSLRRRVVLMQGLVLCTGCRIGELLNARQDLVEEHYLLLHPDAVKTGQPRIIYLSCQALGIAQALRRWSADGQRWMFDVRGQADRFSGWTQSESSWHKKVSTCRRPSANDDQRQIARQRGKKHQQALRRACSTWLGRLDPAVERAQLGHGGGGVVEEYYQEILERMARCMEDQPVPLPAVPGWTWPAPIAAVQRTPERLYEQWRRLVEE